MIACGSLKNSLKEIVTGFFPVSMASWPICYGQPSLLCCNNQRWLMHFKIQQVL